MVNKLESYFESYVKSIDSDGLKATVRDTRDHFEEQFLSRFNWVGDAQGLLYGDVQSGKTSQVCGLVAHAADKNIRNFLVLTSDMTSLVDQTYARFKETFPDFEVFNMDQADDFQQVVKFESAKPRLVVLSKNSARLRHWTGVLKRSNILDNDYLMIVDDEADASSMNNKVNSQKVTAVNGALTKIRQESICCIYLQVTGTPQAVLLQSTDSRWKPSWAFSFKPGAGYIGGNVLFGDTANNPYLKVFEGGDDSDDLDADAQLLEAICSHLVASALILEQGTDNFVSNMLIHPSRLQEDHDEFAKLCGTIVLDFKKNLGSKKYLGQIESAILDLGQTHAGIGSLGVVVDLLHKLFESVTPRVYLVNAKSNSSEREWSKGVNFLVGGNSLGRGLTIPMLQTTIYLRDPKFPQADTLWQHARMFGYDRRLSLLRVFMPGRVAKSFYETNSANNIIRRQIEGGVSTRDIQVPASSTVRSTRPTVVDRKLLTGFVGGVNYFAANPTNESFDELDSLLTDLIPSDGEREVPLPTILTLLDKISASSDDFPIIGLRKALQAMHDTRELDRGLLVVRRGRRIRQGTGSLLSESDRGITAKRPDQLVLVLYRVEGPLGWKSDPIWVPNIKLPEERVFQSMR